MKKFTDQELAQQMCEIYVTYYNTKNQIVEELIEKEINQRIDELSNKTNKTVRYLKDLLEEYFVEFTKEQQRIIKTTKEEIRKKKSITVVEKLKDLSEEELRDFLTTIEPYKLTPKLNKIINGSNPEKSAQAKQILELIRKITKQNEQQKKETYNKEKLTKIKNIFDEMVNNGYFFKTHYCKDYYKQYGLEEEVFKDKVSEYMLFLKRKYPEEYKSYQFLMEQNEWRAWEK